MNDAANRDTTVQRRLLLAAQVLAVAAGLVFGYDAGAQISGMWLGLAMAANAAVFAAFCVSLLADAVFRRKPGAHVGR